MKRRSFIKTILALTALPVVVKAKASELKKGPQVLVAPQGKINALFGGDKGRWDGMQWSANERLTLQERANKSASLRLNRIKDRTI